MKQKQGIVFDREARRYIAKNVKEVRVRLKKSGDMAGRVRIAQGLNGKKEIFIGGERLNGDKIISYDVKKSLRRSRNVK
jgi:hypothetical protein